MQEILEILHSLHERGRTIIIVTHEADIAAHALRIIHIRDGMVYSDEVNPVPRSTARAPLSADSPQRTANSAIWRKPEGGKNEV